MEGGGDSTKIDWGVWGVFSELGVRNPTNPSTSEEKDWTQPERDTCATTKTLLWGPPTDQDIIRAQQYPRQRHPRKTEGVKSPITNESKQH